MPEVVCAVIADVCSAAAASWFDLSKIPIIKLRKLSTRRLQFFASSANSSCPESSSLWVRLPEAKTFRALFTWLSERLSGFTTAKLTMTATTMAINTTTMVCMLAESILAMVSLLMFAATSSMLLLTSSMLELITFTSFSIIPSLTTASLAWESWLDFSCNIDCGPVTSAKTFSISLVTELKVSASTIP